MKSSLRPLLILCLAVVVSFQVSRAEDKKDAAKAEAKAVEMKAGALTLSVPPTWKESDIPNRMRLLTLFVPTAEGDEEKGEFYVSYFRGGGGGIKPNLSRWRGQFASKGLEAKTTKGKAGDKEYYLLDASGTFNKSVGPPIMGRTEPKPGYRMLAAIVVVDGENYFVKLTGPDKTVKAAASGFRKSFGGSEKSEEEYKL